NKTDLVDAAELNAVKKDLQLQNATAAMYPISGIRPIDESVLKVIHDGTN
ncbi:MAG TPA: cobalamin biosynthesis protein P47K, partial [Acetobacterium sp.]|nr:cobalamin biosynthesis protein P47K [Acetobacterium sp.]